MNMNFRFVLFALSCIGLLDIQQAAAQTDHYPNRAIRWVVPYPAGSTVDVVARRFAAVVSDKLGGTIVIDNKPGASGTIGAAEVAKSAPDGYTFLVSIGDPLIASTVMTEAVSYDPLRDFTFIAKYHAAAAMLIVSPETKAATLANFLAQAKAGTMTYGSYGPGSFPQIMMEQLAISSGVKFQEIPYRGPPPAVQDLIANRISATFSSVASLKAISSFGVRPLAIASPKRATSLPDLPTFAEAGFPATILRTMIWSGIFGPVNVPQQIIEKVQSAVLEATRDPSLIKFVEETGGELYYVPGNAFVAEFTEEFQAVTGLLRSRGLALR